MTQGKVIHCTTIQAYHDALQEAKDCLVVVDCYADWCGPCRAMSPIFEELSTEFPDIVFIKVDTDKAPEVKSILGVWALPTFAFVKNGQKVSSFTGANERALRQGLQNNGELGYCSSCAIA